MGECRWHDANLRRNPLDATGLLDCQVVGNDVRHRLCPVSHNAVVANHHFLRFVRQAKASLASLFEEVATAIAATTDTMASPSFVDFAIAVTALNIGDIGGRRRRTVV